MATLDELLEDLENRRRKQPKPMWPDPPPQIDPQGGGGSKALGIVGKLAQLGGMGATMAGAPYLGIPLSVAGGAASGAGSGGWQGALMGAGKAGVSAGIGAGAGKAVPGLLDKLKSPVDTGPIGAFSKAGKGITAPGVRENPIEMFSSSGDPMTVPASPLKMFGGS